MGIQWTTFVVMLIFVSKTFSRTRFFRLISFIFLTKSRRKCFTMCFQEGYVGGAPRFVEERRAWLRKRTIAELRHFSLSRCLEIVTATTNFIFSKKRGLLQFMLKQHSLSLNKISFNSQI